jgi:hypothetical protein
VAFTSILSNQLITFQAHFDDMERISEMSQWMVHKFLHHLLEFTALGFSIEEGAHRPPMYSLAKLCAIAMVIHW